MPKRREIRRLAMQVLYQLDVRGASDEHVIIEGLQDGHDPQPVLEPAVALALAAWKHHDAADALVTELAPQWPTHRQPPVDRALLRLAYHEMVSGYAPPKVSINEAVELAKEYCSEHAPAFVNGVLDKLAKRLAEQNMIPPSPDGGGADPWLKDALGG